MPLRRGIKFGTESQRKLALVFGLLVMTVFLAGSWFASTQKQAHPTAHEPAAQRIQAASTPMLQLELLNNIERALYRGAGRNIFRKLDPPRAPDPRPPARIEEKPAPPGPVPTIRLKFFGFARKLGEPVRIFLTEGDDVFIAGEGEIVNRRYRVVRISSSSVEIEDMLSNYTQHIPLTQG